MATSENVKQELNALNYITGKLEGLSVSSVLRVLSWARAASAGTEAGAQELNAMRSIAARLADVGDASSRTRILHWLDEHYLADDAEPAESTSRPPGPLDRTLYDDGPRPL